MDKIDFNNRTSQCIICGFFAHKYCVESPFIGTFNNQKYNLAVNFKCTYCSQKYGFILNGYKKLPIIWHE